jgi:hypothetical protein
MGGETRCTSPKFATLGVAGAGGAPGNDTGAHRAQQAYEMKRPKGPHTVNKLHNLYEDGVKKHLP